PAYGDCNLLETTADDGDLLPTDGVQDPSTYAISCYHLLVHHEQIYPRKELIDFLGLGSGQVFDQNQRHMHMYST
ncbi:unnamed protein product, partial [Discosporangium mesarthrocarpum]